MAWTQYLQDTFDRANTTQGTAGSTTSVGNGWVDKNGKWKINGNKAEGATADYSVSWLHRPTTESYKKLRFRGRFTYNGVNHLAALRYDPANNDCYLVGNNAQFVGNMWKITGGAISQLAPSLTGSGDLVSGRVYRVEIDCVTDGTTTTITCTYFDETTNGTDTTTSFRASTVSDATADLQTAGTVAVTGNGGTSAWDHITLSQDDGASVSLAVSPTSVTNGTTGNVLQLTGTGTAWTSATTFAVNAGTITGKTFISSTRVDLTYDAPSAAQTVTISNNADSATASLTVAEPSGFAGGTASLGTKSDTTITASITAPTGGATPYTQQWHRSEVQGFTPSGATALAGQTASSLSDTTGQYGRVYHYRCVQADSAGASALSNELVAALKRRAVAVGTIADSQFTAYLGAGTNPLDYVATYLSQEWGERDVTIVNRAISGTTTGDWLPTNGNGYYTNAKNAFAAAGVKAVYIHLGANDSRLDVTPATFSANLQAIVNDLVASGYTVILGHTPYIYVGTGSGQWGPGDIERLFLYRAETDALVNGTTVLRGEKDSWGYAANTPSWYGDGVHFSVEGAKVFGRMLARALAVALLGHGPGGTGGTILVPDSVTPNPIPLGGSPPSITVKRSAGDCTSRCKVHFNGGERATSYVDANTLTAQLLAADVAQSGGATVLIFKP